MSNDVPGLERGCGSMDGASFVTYTSDGERRHWVSVEKERADLEFVRMDGCVLSVGDLFDDSTPTQRIRLNQAETKKLIRMLLATLTGITP